MFLALTRRFLALKELAYMHRLFCLLTLTCLASVVNLTHAQKPEYAIILHGGAFNSLPRDGQPKRDAIAIDRRAGTDAGVTAPRSWA